MILAIEEVGANVVGAFFSYGFGPAGVYVNQLEQGGSKKMKTFASYSHVKTMRGSILVLGPLVAKYHNSKTSLPGGCLIGARPVDYHLSALKKLGMNYKIKDGYIIAKSKGRLKG